MLLLILIIYLVLVFSIQTSILGLVSVAGVTPDLALIFVVYCGIHFQRNAGVGVGFLVGLLQDLLSGRLLGVNTLSKSLIGFFFSTLKEKFMVKGPIPICFFLVTASLADAFVYYFSMVSLLKARISGDFLFPSLFIYLIYNALAGLLLFYVLDKNLRWIIKMFPNKILLPQ